MIQRLQGISITITVSTTPTIVTIVPSNAAVFLRHTIFPAKSLRALFSLQFPYPRRSTTGWPLSIEENVGRTNSPAHIIFVACCHALIIVAEPVPREI